MESNTITLTTLFRVLLIILAAEILAMVGIKMTALPHLVILGSIRVLQIAGILWTVIKWENGLGAIGWDPAQWSKGVARGMLWSIGFAVAAALGMAIIWLAGHNPLQFVRSPLPEQASDLPLFFIVGGLIAPVAEEICFRGVIYTFMRGLATKFGFFILSPEDGSDRNSKLISCLAVFFAMVTSTLVFAVLHAFHGIPVTQAVGGIIFAVAYETSRNLMVPMVIHILGNLAIFTLSLV